MTMLGLLTAFPDVGGGGGGGTLSSESVNVTLNVTEAIHTLSVPQDVRDVYVVTYLLSSFFFCSYFTFAFCFFFPNSPSGLLSTITTNKLLLLSPLSPPLLLPLLFLCSVFYSCSVPSCSATIANSGVFFYTTLKLT